MAGRRSARSRNFERGMRILLAPILLPIEAVYGLICLVGWAAERIEKAWATRQLRKQLKAAIEKRGKN